MRKLILVAFLLIIVLGAFPATALGGGGDGCPPPECQPRYSPGYWKNHPEAWPVPYIQYFGRVVSQADALMYMNAPVRGDKSITMFNAYAAAYLNLVNGACFCGGAQAAFNDARGWLVSFGIGTNIRGNTEAWQYSHGEAIYLALDAWNNGGCPEYWY